MIRTALRILPVTLVLASLLALPATAVEPAAACVGSTPMSAVNVGSTVPDALAKLLGTAPVPQNKSSYVACGESECPPGTNSASFRCMRHCLAMYDPGCVDQCYEDPNTCELILCICTPC